MLLYTRVAPPRVPKRRSRAGCNFCKEKKKKCDETRPKCSRCQETDHDCVYEPVRPRQRRKFESFGGTSPNSLHSIYLSENQMREAFEQEDIFENWQTPSWPFDDALELDSPTSETYIKQTVSIASNFTGNHVSEVPLCWSRAHDCNDLLSPSQSPPFDSTSSDESIRQEDVEEVIRNDITLAASSPTTRDPSFGMVTTTSAPSPHLEFCSPPFAEFSDKINRRALLDHFANVFSHLIVLREDEGNPFQQLVLPISYKSPVVMNAIYALSSAHLERRGVRNCEKSLSFHSQAIQGLASLLAKGCNVNKNELLAAVIVLVYYEVLVQTGRPSIVDDHLKGAMAIMNDNNSPTDPTGLFLERAFRFYDVIAALSLGSAPISPPPGRGGFAPFAPINSRGTTVADGNADALLGMATSLWPIIHRLSTLGGLKKDLIRAERRGDQPQAAILRMEFETTASAVELALQQWDLPAEALTEDSGKIPGARSTASMRKQSILNSAKAYRHSGFVYLYRTVYGFSRDHHVVQRHTHISLTHCVGTVRNGGPMGALLWPLFVAACEAISPADRDLARYAFSAVSKRQGMINIERSSYIVEEVWRRADKGEEDIDCDDATTTREPKQDLWRRVSDDMGVTVVFG